jgi:MerR family transcriptional regulator, light-induced transcriptional regulator
MWNKDEMTPIQEHFISNLVRQKLISATNALPIAEENAQKIVLFLPEQETHEIGILLANYISNRKK